MIVSEFSAGVFTGLVLFTGMHWIESAIHNHLMRSAVRRQADLNQQFFESIASSINQAVQQDPDRPVPTDPGGLPRRARLALRDRCCRD